MAKRVIAAGYEYLGGSSRRYRIVSDAAARASGVPVGSTISRERYEALEGTLRARDATGFKRASARVPEYQRQSRPARGRRVEKDERYYRRARDIRAKRGSVKNHINIPMYIELDQSDADIMAEAETYRPAFNSVLLGLSRNKYINGLGFIASVTGTTVNGDEVSFPVYLFGTSLDVGTIPDITLKRVINDLLTHNFGQGDYQITDPVLEDLTIATYYSKDQYIPKKRRSKSKFTRFAA